METRMEQRDRAGPTGYVFRYGIRRDSLSTLNFRFQRRRTGAILPREQFGDVLQASDFEFFRFLFNHFSMSMRVGRNGNVQKID